MFFIFNFALCGVKKKMVIMGFALCGAKARPDLNRAGYINSNMVANGNL